MDNTLLSIVFIKKSNKFELKYKNGLQLTFPCSKIEALKGQNHSIVEVISILDKGSNLYWPELGLKIPVTSLGEVLLKGETWSLSGSS